MTVRGSVVAFAALPLAFLPFTARADFSACVTPTPSPLPPLFYFSPPDGAAGVATNAAILFQSNVGTMQVMIGLSGGTLAPAIGADHFAKTLDVFQLTSSLKPSTHYHLSLVDVGSQSTLQSATFVTGTGGDPGAPSFPGIPSIVTGAFVADNTNPFCPSPALYFNLIGWPAATEPGQSYFVYEVVASDATGTKGSISDDGVIYWPGSLALMGTAVSGFATASTALNVTVYAFDQAGFASSITKTFDMPAPLIPENPPPDAITSCTCAVSPDSRGWLGCIFAGLTALVAVRVRRRAQPQRGWR